MRLNPFRKSRSRPSVPVPTAEDRRLTELQKQSDRAQQKFRKHLDCIEPIEHWYKLRDSNPQARAKAIQACERQIAISQESVTAWHEWGRLNGEILKLLDGKRSDKPWGVPSHTGFTQLVIIREKDGDFLEAIRLCQQAKKDGWAGDWDKRITRLEGKLAKTK